VAVTPATTLTALTVVVALTADGGVRVWAGVAWQVGGSQREERLDVLLARMSEMGLKEEDYSAYLDTRRFGSHPHSGFGVGFERLVLYATAMGNIRDVIPFPRTVGQMLH
jgi:asparaginyl-tRNA synthetase